ncbi:MAG: glycosyltransferase [Pseudomonadota bacterium]
MAAVALAHVFGLIRRFFQVLRHAGWRAALVQTSGYLNRLSRGLGYTSLRRSRSGSDFTGRYPLMGIWRLLAQENAFHVLTSPSITNGRRAIALIGDLNLPQCRKYRVEQLAELWRDQDIAFDYAHFEDVPRAGRILQQATHVMEYRLQSNETTEMLRYEARRLRLPILYDIDDPLFSISAYETYGNMQALAPALRNRFLADAPKYLSMMNGADALCVSTPGLQCHAQLFTNRPVFFRRNFADAQTLETGRAAMDAAVEKDDLFRIAFASGSQGHEADLATILEPLIHVLQTCPNTRLLIIGHFNLKHLPGELYNRIEKYALVDYSRYLHVLARADCVVMPLSDDLFNACKSGVRALDAAAVGVPAVVAAVGDLPNVVAHGQTGFVAEKPQDWFAFLEQLVRDPAHSQRLGQAARLALERRWRGTTQPHIASPELLAWVA